LGLGAGGPFVFRKIPSSLPVFSTVGADSEQHLFYKHIFVKNEEISRCGDGTK
jgi:hypothetical protein